MGDYADLLKTLRANGVLLKADREAADVIETLTREKDAAIARAEAAEKEIGLIVAREAETVETAFKLQDLLREAELVIKLLLNTPEIADCDPRDKDTETQIAERFARAMAARITAATQTETGGKDD
jgi:hypothetical protein